MAVQTFHLSHLPPELAVHAALFCDVKNASFLRGQLLNGNAEFEYAFLDASVILSTTHILAAAFRAINDYLNNRLKTRNVHSETVFSLSPNNNIAESFRRFGISDASKDIVVIKIATDPSFTPEFVQSHLSGAVQGTPAILSDETLKGIADIGRLTKIYKLGSPLPKNSTKKVRLADSLTQPMINDTKDLRIIRDERKEMEIAILGMMALKGSS